MTKETVAKSSDNNNYAKNNRLIIDQASSSPNHATWLFLFLICLVIFLFFIFWQLKPLFSPPSPSFQTGFPTSVVDRPTPLPSGSPEFTQTGSDELPAIKEDLENTDSLESLDENLRLLEEELDF